MKLIAKPIDVVVVFFCREKPRPYRLRYKDENGEDKVIKIEKIISVEETRIPGPKALVYECQSTRGCIQYRYQLLYNPESSSWLLYKI